MVRGFYMLTSGMLTQNRILNTVSNNVANLETNGYKAQHLAPKTFGKMMIDRIDSQRTPIGEVTLMTTAADKADTVYAFRRPPSTPGVKKRPPEPSPRPSGPRPT